MRRSSPLACLVVALFVAGCDPDEPPPAPEVAAAEAPAPQSFAMHGAPGPWWRSGAAKADFDAESRACLRASQDARRAAVPDEKSAAAYEAFLACMQERGWRRGLRPARLTTPAR